MLSEAPSTKVLHVLHSYSSETCQNTHAVIEELSSYLKSEEMSPYSESEGMSSYRKSKDRTLFDANFVFPLVVYEIQIDNFCRNCYAKL